MAGSIFVDMKVKIPKIRRFKLVVLLLIFLVGLTVFQDYLFAVLQNTGFHLSESVLYNFFWLLFLPFFLITYYLASNFYSNNTYIRVISSLVIGAIVSLLHIIVFAFLFVSISKVLYSPPHRFSGIFKSMLSNQLYFAFLFYTLAPNAYYFFSQKQQMNAKPILKYSEKISFRIGAKIRSIETAAIQAISTDKPYSVIHTNEHAFLVNKSLKVLESELDPTVFLRVHRSAIVNCKFIKDLKSRKNGDYDALFENGVSIRFSRHYRKNWLQLLQSA